MIQLRPDITSKALTHRAVDCARLRIAPLEALNAPKFADPFTEAVAPVNARKPSASSWVSKL